MERGKIEDKREMINRNRNSLGTRVRVAKSLKRSSSYPNKEDEADKTKWRNPRPIRVSPKVVT